MDDYSEITDNIIIIDLLKQKEKIEKQIKEIDDMVLVKYAIKKLCDEE